MSEAILSGVIRTVEPRHAGVLPTGRIDAVELVKIGPR